MYRNVITYIFEIISPYLVKCLVLFCNNFNSTYQKVSLWVSAPKFCPISMRIQAIDILPFPKIFKSNTRIGLLKSASVC